MFVLSGLYFKLVLDGLQGMENTPRLLLRTSHLYLFLTSVINFVLGLYYVQPKDMKWFTIYNQSLIMLSPFLIGYGFIFETMTNEGIDRVVGSLGLFAIFAWLVNILIARIYRLFKAGRALKVHGGESEAP